MEIEMFSVNDPKKDIYYHWYAYPNDLIGGWCVMNIDKMPSSADGHFEYAVADFISEELATHIATLHNNWLDEMTHLGIFV